MAHQKESVDIMEYQYTRTVLYQPHQYYQLPVIELLELNYLYVM